MNFSLRNEETTFTKPQYVIKIAQLPYRRSFELFIYFRLHLSAEKEQEFILTVRFV